MKKIATVLTLILASFVFAQNPNDVIINEYNDGGGNCGSPEWVELLVVNGPVDLRNWYITDEEWSTLPTVNEGVLQISNNAAFASVPTGTYVVLIDGSGVDDTDASDKQILLYSDNSNLTETGSFNLATGGDGIILAKDDDNQPGEKDEGEMPVDYVSWGDERDVPPGITWNTAISGTEDEDSYFSDGANFNNDDAADWVTNADGSGCGDRTMGSANPGQDDSSLPVQLTAFTAKAGDGFVLLNWTTASEVENQGYIILRKQEGEEKYREVASYATDPSLSGAGNSSHTISYAFLDQAVINGVTYWYKLVDVDMNGFRTEHGPVSATPQANSDPITELLPGHFYLKNFPNPFNPSTTIEFDLSALKQSTIPVTLTISDVTGKTVRTLFKGTLNAQTHRFTWDGTNEQGKAMPSGLYFYTLQTPLKILTQKMILMR